MTVHIPPCPVCSCESVRHLLSGWTWSFTPFPLPCVFFCCGEWLQKLRLRGSVCNNQACPAGLCSACLIRVGGTWSIPAPAGSGRPELRGASDAQLVRWPVQQTCYMHSKWIYALLAPGGSTERGEAPRVPPAAEGAGSWPGAALALLHPCRHQRSAARALGEDPTDVRPPYGSLLTRDVFSNKRFK